MAYDPSKSFREQFLEFKQPSPQREDFVYQAVTSKISKDQLLAAMKPITTKKPDGTKITYKVMPDYVSIDGMRVPMSGNTAQRVANYFGLNLPPPQMTQEIYQNADVKVPAKPLSGTGTVVDGKEYSGNEVVRKGVGYADFAANYNDVINQQLSEKGVQEGQIVSGFAKDVTAPVPGKEHKLGLHGFYDAKGKPIQGGSGETPHDTTIHGEYGAFTRLVSSEVEIEHPDGTKETVPLEQAYQTSSYKTPEKKTEEKKTKPEVSETPAQDKPETSAVASSKPASTPTSKKPQTQQPQAQQPTEEEALALQKIKSIDQILGAFTSVAHERRRNIVKRALRIRLSEEE